MCDVRKPQPRLVRPPVKIASREATSKICSEIVKIIKNSPLFICMVQMRIQITNLVGKMQLMLNLY